MIGAWFSRLFRQPVPETMAETVPQVDPMLLPVAWEAVFDEPVPPAPPIFAETIEGARSKYK